MENVILIHLHLEALPMIMDVKKNIEVGGITIILMKRAITVTKDITKCSTLLKKVPSFNGDSDPNVYLEWEPKVDHYFHVY